MADLHLKVVTPSEEFYNDNIQYALVRTVCGDTGIMKRHAPYAGVIKNGKIRITDMDGNQKSMICSDGVMSVHNDEISVIADKVKWAEGGK